MNENPNDDDASAALRRANEHDRDGREAEAATFYEQALRGGLSNDELRSALLGLGSTYRNLGRLDDSESLLRRGLDAFPDDRSFVPFLALTLHRGGRSAEAVAMLLRELVERGTDTNILNYRRAILAYSAELDNAEAGEGRGI